ncbi:MAG: ABC transporter permease [Tannerella sp.]|jgi:putative ABC transport system permease protein|nr:ABC transporter permease [Tannerella sp.]
MFRNLFITIRNLRRSGVYSVINIAGLAMSLATCAFIALWVQDETSFDTFHKDAKDMYRVITNFKIQGQEMDAPVTNGLFGPVVKDDFAGEVYDYCRIRNWGTGYVENGEIKTPAITCLYSDHNFFDFFSFPIVKGNSVNPLQNPTDVVISERLATQLFGDEDPVGQMATLQNGKAVMVTAVMKNFPKRTELISTGEVDLVSLYSIEDSSTYLNQKLTSFDGAEFYTILKIHPGADLKQITDDIYNKQPEMYRTQMQRSYTLQPFMNSHLYSMKGEPTGVRNVRMFEWIAIIVLLIACINYVNLVTARASKRYKEIVLRKVLGAKKVKLFMQLIGEAVVLFVIAVIVALFLNFLLKTPYNMLSGKEIQFDIFNLNIWTVYLVMFVVVVGLAGLYPAWLLASFKANNMIQTAQSKRGSNLFRRSLVVLQFVASTTLIVGTIGLSTQMKYMRDKAPGYNREQVLTCNMYNMRKSYDAVKAELERQPSILGVSSASDNIMNGGGSADGFSEWEGKTTEGMFIFNQIRVDTSFVPMMQFNLVEGTNFTSNNPSAQYILNEAAVKAMGLTDPVGKWVQNSDKRIVGVVKDFHFASLHKEIEPLVMYYEPRYIYMLYMRINPGNAQQAIAALEAQWKQYNSEFAFEYSFLDDTFDRMYKSDIQINSLFGTFSVIAILISCMGLLGLVVFSAELRTKEIGIRKVLGAGIPSIVRMLSLEFLILVGIALVIAIPLSYYMLDNLLQDFVYRIPLSWWIFASAAVITVLLTLITVSLKAFRAASANPVDAIKTE